MPNIMSDSSNPLHHAAARLELLHDQLDDAHNEQLKFADWCQQKAETCEFHYWATVLQLEVTVLVYVRSLLQASFAMYVAALTELAVWFRALDRSIYGRGFLCICESMWNCRRHTLK